MEKTFNDIYKLCLFIAFTVGFLPLLAQVTIYLDNNQSFSCQSATIEGNNVNYLPYGSAKSEKKKLKQVLMILKNDGSAIIVDDNQPNYIQFDNEDHSIIFLKDRSIFRARELSDSNYDIEFIDYNTYKQKSIPIQELGAILNHNMVLTTYTDLQEVAEMILKSGPKLANTQNQIGSSGGNELGAESNPGSSLDTTSLSYNDNGSRPNSNRTEEKSLDETVTDSFQLKDADPLEIPVKTEAFEERARDKVKKFTDYVEKILESEDRYQKNVIIKQARILFVDDTCIVQVSNVNNSDKKDYTVRQYFEHIKDVGKYYTRVDVTIGDVYYVSNLRKQDDGNWYGTVSFIQKFSGFKDDLLVYQDRTTKNVNVVLKIFEPEINGMREVVWDVLLSNVLVEHTTK